MIFGSDGVKDLVEGDEKIEFYNEPLETLRQEYPFLERSQLSAWHATLLQENEIMKALEKNGEVARLIEMQAER